MSILKLGDLTPELSLYDANGVLFQLLDYKIKKFLLLLFYSGNNDRLSIANLVQFDKMREEFLSYSTDIIGISTDSIAEAKITKDVHKMEIPLLTGLTKEMAENFGLFFDEKNNRCLPAIFLTDVVHKIQYASIHTHPTGFPSPADITNILKQFIR